MAQPPELLHTSINRTWMLKMSIFTLVLIGFGCWALFDAAILYPSRGLGYSSVKLRDFLAAAESAGLLRNDKIAIPDPKATLAQLDAKADELGSTARREDAEGRAAKMELARRDYLESLAVVWKLNPADKPLGDYVQQTAGLPALAHTLTFKMTTGEGIDQIAEQGKAPRTETLDAQKLLAELKRYWSSTSAATALSGWDLPVQWFFVLVGFGGGAYLLVLIARCKASAKRITFEPESQRLTLATGESVVPSDLRDIDKRLWHKYYCILITESGQEHKIDLLRYVPLEDWVLQMERTRFPDRAAEEDKNDGEGSAPSETPVESAKSE